MSLDKQLSRVNTRVSNLDFGALFSQVTKNIFEFSLWISISMDFFSKTFEVWGWTDSVQLDTRVSTLDTKVSMPGIPILILA